MRRQLPRSWLDLQRDWPVLTYYQRFETTVAFVLTCVVGAVILVALVRLVVGVLEVLVLQALNPLDHAVFQEVFGQILTLLIALEFNHTLQYVITRERGIIQAGIVVLIAELAVARKLIVTDFVAAGPGTIAALGGLVLALGVTYWLIRASERRNGRPSRPHQRPAEAA